MLCLISLLLNTKINVLQHWLFFNVTVASEANLGWWGLLDFKYQNFDKQKKKKDYGYSYV